MRKAKRMAGFFGLWLGLAALGLLAGGALPAPAAAHPCEQDECDSFLIFWERCEANTGQNTACDSGADGCTTMACGHA